MSQPGRITRSSSTGTKERDKGFELLAPTVPNMPARQKKVTPNTPSKSNVTDHKLSEINDKLDGLLSKMDKMELS